MVFTCYTNYGVVLSGVAANRCPLCELLLQLRRLCSGLCRCHICRLSCCVSATSTRMSCRPFSMAHRGERLAGIGRTPAGNPPLLTGLLLLVDLRRLLLFLWKRRRGDLRTQEYLPVGGAVDPLVFRTVFPALQPLSQILDPHRC